MNNWTRGAALVMAVAGVAVAAPYKDPQGFTVTPPNGWTVTKEVPGVTVAFLGPRTAAGFTTNANVIVQALPGNVDLKTFTSLTLQQLEAVITGYKLVSNTKTTLGGAPAQRLKLQGKQGKFDLYFDQVFALKGGRAYAVTVTVPRAQANTAGPIMDQFIKSFKITR
ncbi:DcrB-related protein [Deinococcus maricopensis]|uniref:PsbP C-terminal domain-containing protein n=1 Tax=Deinococcus maricopensis (strain DSM 21211 / LMG 22137 / NRRL B-23946 / LB-34) TaxID=709986 RepID=E8U9V1_DEIML|nr:DcrB-related protein [Deinococcus maricopensis]ADV67840.1 hypothetical protein Deima_2200 [Deinococcus maricopensis DSM 21211]